MIGNLYLFLFLAIQLVGLTALAGQANSDAPSQANPADVESVDKILAAIYDVISGPAGIERDWNRFRSLFVTGAKLIPTVGAAEESKAGCRMLTPDDYVTQSGPYLEKEGFFEKEVHRVVERFGPIAHVFSTYEARRKLDDSEPFVRGINSFQLFHDGRRWWVVNIYWASEQDDYAIPAKYLP